VKPAPLRFRLPNAPPQFVGRAAELDWLKGALDRSPVAIVCGPSGIGKTALVLAALHRFAPASVPRTLFIPIRPGDLAAQLRVDLVQTLLKMTGEKRELDPSEPEALVEAAIDLAESHAMHVVLDDAHHADAEEMSELLVQLGAYARKARFIVTQRNPPAEPNLAAVTLAVSAMPRAELEALAQALDFERGGPEAQQLAGAASGSPWLLTQLALGKAPLGAQSAGRDHLLSGLPAPVDGFLSALSVLHLPAPIELFERLGLLPDAAALAELERRGIVFRHASGLRLHDMAAGLLARSDGPTHAELARGLSELEAPELVVEAVRLFVEGGDVEAAVRLLDVRASDVFASGQAPRLFAAIKDLRDKRLSRHQLKAATELGNPTALTAVRQSEPAGEELAWCEVLYASGDLVSARAAAARQRDEARRDGNGPRHLAASLLHVRCLVHAMELDAALAELGGLEPDDDDERLRVRALSLRARAVAGLDGAEADALELARRFRAAPPTALEPLEDVAAALAELHRHDAAEELLGLVLATPRGAATPLAAARRALALSARMKVDAGQLDGARAAFERLGPYLRSATLLRPSVLAVELERRLAAGELDGIDSWLEVLAHDAGTAEVRCATAAERVRDELALLRAEPPNPAEPPRTALRARRLVRQGARAAAPAGSSAVERALLAAEAAALAGDSAAALDAAANASQLARSSGFPLLEAAAAAVRADVCAAAGRDDARREAAAELAALAARIGSKRWQHEAELMTSPPLERLEVLAAGSGVSPIAARRARLLLGADGPADALDGVVVRRLQAAGAKREVRLVRAGAPEFPGWGLDCRTKTVWLPGRRVELESRPLLFQVLAQLARTGGASGKEALVVGVWGEREYHPGRHDPRLQMTVRKVREAIEDDASAPARVLTAEDGYVLAGPLRIVE